MDKALADTGLPIRHMVLVIGVITEGHTTRRNARLIVGSLLKNGNETLPFCPLQSKHAKESNK